MTRAEAFVALHEAEAKPVLVFLSSPRRWASVPHSAVADDGTALLLCDQQQRGASAGTGEQHRRDSAESDAGWSGATRGRARMVRFGYRELPLAMPHNQAVAEMASHVAQSMSEHGSEERASEMASKAPVARGQTGGA